MTNSTEGRRGQAEQAPASSIPAQPDGEFVLVPRKMTEAMHHAAMMTGWQYDREAAEDIWPAILAAAAFATPPIPADTGEIERLREALESIAEVGPNGVNAKNGKACRAIARTALQSSTRSDGGGE